MGKGAGMKRTRKFVAALTIAVTAWTATPFLIAAAAAYRALGPKVTKAGEDAKNCFDKC